jgi:6-phosphogluconate dehydrogenase
MILLVKAGPAVDAFIKSLTPHLEKGDIIIDGGNSHYPDTIRRCKEVEDQGFLYVGSGVSGGEEGARYGPSLMPGGSDVSLSTRLHMHSMCADKRILSGCLAPPQGNLPEDCCSVGRRAVL